MLKLNVVPIVRISVSHASHHSFNDNSNCCSWYYTHNAIYATGYARNAIYATGYARNATPNQPRYAYS